MFPFISRSLKLTKVQITQNIGHEKWKVPDPLLQTKLNSFTYKIRKGVVVVKVVYPTQTNPAVPKDPSPIILVNTSFTYKTHHYYNLHRNFRTYIYNKAK